MKKKALLFLPYLAPYRIDILNELNNTFELIVIFQFENAPEQSFDQAKLRKKLKAKCEIFNKGFNIGTRQIRIGVSSLIKRYCPDIIFCNEYGATSILLSYYKRSGFFDYDLCVTTSDNLLMACGSKWFRKIARNYVIKSAKKVLVYSEEVGAWYRQKFPGVSVRTCPNIQNPEILLTEIYDYHNIANYYKKYYSLEEKRVALYIGRLDRVKGLDRLIMAFSKICSNDHLLILIGDGQQKNYLVSLAEKLMLNKNILFPGRFDGAELYAWYFVADFFVLSSLYEPFGAVVNEALIFGLPVLCSKYAGAKIFIHDSVNGFVFNPNDGEEFELFLKKAFQLFNHKNELQNLMEYSFEQSVKQYEEIFYLS